MLRVGDHPTACLRNRGRPQNGRFALKTQPRMPANAQKRQAPNRCRQRIASHVARNDRTRKLSRQRRERAARTYAQVARLRFRRSRAPRTPGFPNSVISCHAGVDSELSCPSLSPIQLAESVRRIERARTMQWRRVRCRTVGHSRGSEGEAGKRAERASRFTLSRGRAGTRG